MNDNNNIGIDEPNPNNGHHCLKCNSPFGGGVLLKYLMNINATDIQCPECFKPHEFDTEGAKLIPLLIFVAVFLATAAGLIYLVLYQWRTQGMLFYFQLVLPIVIGFIAGGMASKFYRWKTGKIVLFGH